MAGQVAVVGAGPAGALLAILLARRGVPVDVYEWRDDPRGGQPDGGISINLGVSARGIRALREVGQWERLRERTVPMRGRMVHGRDGALRFHPYGNRPDEILYSIDRRELTAALIDRAEKYGSARFHFGHRCTGLDRATGAIRLAGPAGRERTARPELVVGADGVHSTVRAHLLRGGPAAFHEEVLGWGYREVNIPAYPDGTPRTPIEALHVWPSPAGLVVAHPNLDMSLTGTVLLPLDREPGRPASFATLTGESEVAGFFRDTFADLPALVPDLVAQFRSHPTGRLVTIRVHPWQHAGRVVLVGDAAHAVYPFYGQGMNASLEDCLVLDACLQEYAGDPAGALARYQQLRKPHTDVLADLSARNFVQLRDRVRSPWHRARATVDRTLNRLAPRAWRPLYTMVSHTTVPYGEAVRRARIQDGVLLGAAAGAVAGVALAAGAAASRWRR